MKYICCLAVLALAGCRNRENPVLFPIVDREKMGFINDKGAVVIPAAFQNVGVFSEGLAPARLEGEFGFINETGEFVIKPQFDFAEDFEDGLAIVYKDGRPLYIDHDGKKVFDHPFAVIGHFVNDRAIVKTDSGRVGLIDRSGKLKVDTIYKSIEAAGRDRYIVEGIGYSEYSDDLKKKLAIGVVDANGKFIIPFGKYMTIEPYNNGYAEIEIPADENDTTGLSQITGFVDLDGKLIFSKDARDNVHISGPVINGTVDARISESPYRCGIMDLKGNMIFKDSILTYINDFRHGVSFAEDTSGNYYLIDTKGKLVSTQPFDTYSEFVDGLAIVSIEGSYGAIDTNGRLVIAPKFQRIETAKLTDDLFVFQEERVNKILYGIGRRDSSDIVIPARFTWIDQVGYRNGLLMVMEEERMGYIDRNGKYVWRQARPGVLAASDTLNIDYMNRGYCFGASLPDRVRGYNGWARSSNVPNPIEAKHFPDGFTMQVNVAESSQWLDRFPGTNLYVVNNTENNIYFNAENSRLSLKLQAQDRWGTWKDIEYLPSSWCGNSYHEIELPVRYYFSFRIPVFKGILKTKLRAKLLYLNREKDKESILYSNTFDGSINPGQFWRKPNYTPLNIMDPYNE